MLLLLLRVRARLYPHTDREVELIPSRTKKSYVRKLVTELSGGVFGYLDSVLERHSFDEFGELI